MPTPGAVAYNRSMSAAQTTADEIAALLGESDPVPMEQIQRIVARLGAERALAFAQRAVAIEAAGGRLRRDGERRTLGGVFFRLVKRAVIEADRVVIWPELRDRPRPPRARPPRIPAWAERLPIVRDAASERGKVHSVKITLVGRPGKIIEQPTFIATMLDSGKLPPLPKGLPAPPAGTAFLVYIARRHWARVAASLRDPDDALIVEGVPLLDADQRHIAVFALHVTTKLLQRAQRQSEAAPDGE